MISILMPFLASGILISSSVTPLSPQATTEATPSFVFTRVLPEDNFVAHLAAENEGLKKIANRYYGDSAYWTNIWNDNPDISNPNKLADGFLVKLQVSTPDEVENLDEALVKKLSKLYSTSVYTLPVSYPVSTYDAVYRAAGEKYGIPWQVLYGLHYTETGLRDGEIYNHQGSGAQGPMQFMPGTWRAYGVDGDGDGVANINQAVDSIYGAANYLAKHGSLQDGLRAYGGNTSGTLAAAKSKGFNL